jgi:hypothetical protein
MYLPLRAKSLFSGRGRGKYGSGIPATAEGFSKFLTCLAAGLATGAAGLQMELLAPFLEGRQPLLGPAGQVDVHTRAHT